MYTLKENQYSPNGIGRPAETYYYFTNEDGKVIDKETLKPYRGKQMNRYAIKNKIEAQKHLAKINGEPMSMTLKEFEKNYVTDEIEDKYWKDFERGARFVGYGVYSWHSIKAGDTRTLFLLGVAAREGIYIKTE